MADDSDFGKLALAFLVGVGVGRNWEETREYLKSFRKVADDFMDEGLKFLLGGKELMEDRFAELDIEKRTRKTGESSEKGPEE